MRKEEKGRYIFRKRYTIHTDMYNKTMNKIKFYLASTFFLLILTTGAYGNNITEKPSKLFDISFDVSELNIHNSNDLYAIVNFESFGREPTPVKLKFSILNNEGKEVHTEETSFIVETYYSFTNRFVSLQLIPGEYEIVLTTLYNIDVQDEFRKRFTIKEEKMVNSPYYVIGSVILILLFIFTFLICKKDEIKK